MTIARHDVASLNDIELLFVLSNNHPSLESEENLVIIARAHYGDRSAQTLTEASVIFQPSEESGEEATAFQPSSRYLERGHKPRSASVSYHSLTPA